jgi:hypothetical protein
MKKLIVTICAFAFCLICTSMIQSEPVKYNEGVRKYPGGIPAERGALTQRVRYEEGIRKYPGGFANPRCRLEEGACGCCYEPSKRFYPSRKPT